jgi:hypothetical protein
LASAAASDVWTQIRTVESALWNLSSETYCVTLFHPRRERSRAMIAVAAAAIAK